MERVFVIAEAGVNHNGDLKIAKQLVDAAVWAGADAVKFQTFRAESVVSKFAEKAEYQKKTMNDEQKQIDLLKKLELSEEKHKYLMEYCKKKEILFLSTPFDLESIDFLVKIGIELLKIPSGEITNLPYLRRVASTGKKVIMSTGMSDLNEVQSAVSVLRQYGSEDISLLHCNTEYPTPVEDVNLRAMVTLHENLDVTVGYSDHTSGIEIPIAAVAMGAKIIEKHFTVDRTMEGPDQNASLEPTELKKMIEAIRNVEVALGDGKKIPSKSEKKNIDVVRKSIVAKRTICKGEFFSEENLTTKRPGIGISPMMWNEIIGLVANRTFYEDEIIEV